jgi:transposase
MGPSAAALVAGIIDRIENRPFGPGRPPLPTIKVVETLRYFVREGVQWRELRATAGRACGSILRRRLDDWSATALLRQVHVALIRMVRAGPEIALWDVVVDSCSVRAKRGGELTGPNPTDRGKAGTKYHVVVSTDGIPLAAVPSAANVSTTRGSSRICCVWPRWSAPPSAGCTPTRATTARRTAASACRTASSPTSARWARRTAPGSARSAASSSMIARGCWPTSGWIGARTGSAA